MEEDLNFSSIRAESTSNVNLTQQETLYEDQGKSNDYLKSPVLSAWIAPKVPSRKASKTDLIK